MAVLSTNTISGLASALGSKSGAKEIEERLAVGQGVFSVASEGADPTGVNDSTAAIQAAFDAAANNGSVYFPPGTYRITDTIKVTRGVSFDSVEAYGFGGIDREAGAGSVTIVTDFTANDRPAISIQGARYVRISGLEIVGENVAPLNDRYDDQTHITDVEADWVTAGCSTGRYNPYCGIAIDPYSGTEPSGGYDNDDYGRVSSLGVEISDCVIKYFVVGIAIKPSDNDTNADWVTIKRVMPRHCTYGISIGGAQQRAVTVSDCYMWNNMCNFTGVTNGKQQGTPPVVRGGLSIWSYRIFNFNQGFGHLSLSGFYAEAIEQIGYWGNAAASTTHTASIEGCHFKFRNISGLVDVNDTPYQLAAYAPMAISGSTFNMESCWFNVVGASSADVTFTGCSWLDVTAENDDIFYIGLNAAGAGPKIVTHGSAFRTNLILENTAAAWNGADTDTILTTLPGRVDLSLHSRRVNGPLFGCTVAHSPLASAHYGVNANAGTYVWDGSEVSFTATSGAEFAVGDKLYWQTYADPWLADAQFTPVALIVTAVNSNTVTATALCGIQYLDTTYNPGSVTIAYRPYAHTAPVMGSLTSASASITGVTSASTYFKVGDFIAGTGIVANSRVTNVSGTTVTISKNATATNSNVFLYFDRLVPLSVPQDSANAFWAAQDNSTDDANSIMACLQFWKRCRLMGGTAYRINTQIVMPANTTLSGASLGNSFLQAESGVTAAIISAGTRCTVRDVQLLGNDTASSIGVQVHAGSSGNIVLDRVGATDFAEGFVLDTSIAAESKLIACRASSCTSNGVRIGTTGPSGVSLIGCVLTSNATGLLVNSGPSGLSVQGCVISSNSAHGISITGSATSPHITGNYFTSNSTADIAFSGNVRAGVVSGNTFASSAICFTASNGNDCVIFGNTFNGTVSLTLTSANCTRYDIGQNTYLADAFDYAADNSGTHTRYQGQVFVNAAPSTGTWLVGQVVWDISPTSGQPAFWVCSAAPNTFIAGPNLA